MALEVFARDAELYSHPPVPVGTVGRLFDEILRPAAEGPRIGQLRFGVGPADSGAGLDLQGGGLPLGVLELRDYGPARFPRRGIVHLARLTVAHTPHAHAARAALRCVSLR